MSENINPIFFPESEGDNEQPYAKSSEFKRLHSGEDVDRISEEEYTARISALDKEWADLEALDLPFEEKHKLGELILKEKEQLKKRLEESPTGYSAPTKGEQWGKNWGDARGPSDTLH